MAIPKAYKAVMRIPIERYVEIDNDFDFSRITVGIVFVLARWSMASQVSFRALNDVLYCCRMPDELKIYVVDTDSPVANRFFALANGVRGGYGETFLVKSGKVQRQLDLATADSKNYLQTYLNDFFG